MPEFFRVTLASPAAGGSKIEVIAAGMTIRLAARAVPFALRAKIAQMRAEIGFARLGEACPFFRVAADEATKRSPNTLEISKTLPSSALINYSKLVLQFVKAPLLRWRDGS
jgi:hypothetical protein